MKILVIPDPAALTERPGLRRIPEAVRARFGKACHLVLGLSEEQQSQLSETPANVEIQPLKRALESPEF